MQGPAQRGMPLSLTSGRAICDGSRITEPLMGEVEFLCATLYLYTPIQYVGPDANWASMTHQNKQEMLELRARRPVPREDERGAGFSW